MRIAIALSAGLILPLSAAAEPIKFVNDGSLIWNPGGVSTLGAQPDICDPLLPVPGFRAFSPIRGVEQFTVPSPFPAPIPSLCYNRARERASSADAPALLIVGSGAAIAASPPADAVTIPGTLFPSALYRVPQGFAPGEIISSLMDFRIGSQTAAQFDAGLYYGSCPALAAGGPACTSFLKPLQFVGLRVQEPDGPHYGWMLLGSDTSTTFQESLVPIEWAVESFPDTQIIIESTHAYSPIPARTTSTVHVESANGAARDSLVHYMAGPASGLFAGGLTPAIFQYARTGTFANIIAKHPDWTGPAMWNSTNPTGSNAPTTLYAIDFDMGFFDSSLSQISLHATVNVADRLGQPGVAGIYVNGLPVPGSDGIGSAGATAFVDAAGLESMLHPGVNTLYFYTVNLGALPAFGSGSGLAFSADFSIRRPVAVLTPPVADIQRGETFQFHAGVIGTRTTSVVWTCTGGTITPEGLFIAPAETGGRFLVRLQSIDLPSVFAQAMITVHASDCAADFNLDGHTDPDDLGDFITAFFSDPPGLGADFNHDGDINPDDLGDFITLFFASDC